MKKIHVASVAALLALTSPAFAASAADSQLGAAGPRSDPWGSAPTSNDAGKPAVVETAAPLTSADQPPCGANDLKTELERKHCN
jgi:hypothetical protein